MKTKVYMHTLDGQPARWYEDAQIICFIGVGSFCRSGVLRPSLKQIKKEQAVDKQNCSGTWRRGHIGFYLKETEGEIS